MSNPAKRKGSAFERDVVAYFREQGFQAERAYGAGRPDDRGDIVGVPGFVVECKNHARLELAAWCDEAVKEAANAGARRWCVIFKRKARPTADAYVTMDLATFCDLAFINLVSDL